MEETIAKDRESTPEEIAVGKTEENIEEIDSSPVATTTGKAVSRSTATKEEPIPNPLLQDPYEWDSCTITVAYALHPDRSVTISIHNHKDEPIVKSFVADDVPLPDKIGEKLQTLQAIWPDSTVSATIVLLPKTADATERALVVSMRAGGDTPIVMTDLASNIPFPTPINSMLDELRALLPSRALKRIEKDAKTKIAPQQKLVAKVQPKQITKTMAASPNTPKKSQLSLF